MSYLIIADIAGQYDALMRLIALVPKAIPVSVGDMCDRGPRSREVFEYFMGGKRRVALLGNHEHMMIDHLCKGGRHSDYGRGAWASGWGAPTLASFPDGKVPKEMLDWIGNLPVAFEVKSKNPKVPHLFVSHAPSLYTVDEMMNRLPDSARMEAIWNRDEPLYEPGYIQVFGHNSFWGLREFHQNGERYAICIDQSPSMKLTGYLYPEGKVLEVPYVQD